MEDYKKKYEDALERAKKLQANAKGLVLNKWLYGVFPELKESKDERIRKDLITFLDDIWHLGKNTNFDRWSKADCSDWIVWLEKQGEQKPVEPNWVHHKVDLSECSEEYRKAYYDGWNNCNQQHAQLEAEQKLTWDEEDDTMEQRVQIVICKSSLPASTANLLSDWLKSLKNKLSFHD